MSRSTALFGVLLSAALLSACAIGRSVEQTQRLQRRLDSHVYNVDPEKLVLALEPLLKDRGYETRPDPAAWYIDTEWLKDQSRGFFSRYEAKAQSAGEGKSKISITRVAQRTGKRNTQTTAPVDTKGGSAPRDNTALAAPPGVQNEVERDLDLELELLKKVDAAAHGAIVAQQ